MKLQKEVTVPKIEIDLSRIQQLSQEHGDEINSWRETLSDQLIRGCCIDRLRRHNFAETGFLLRACRTFQIKQGAEHEVYPARGCRGIY
jgi:hypothetical protein